MLLGVCLLLCLATVPLAGGRIGRLADVRFEATWAIALALAIQLVIVYAFPGEHPAALKGLLLCSYGLALWFVVCNARVPGVLLMGLGGGLNLLAIAANGGVMPATRAALQTAGLSERTDGFASSIALDDARLAWLGDVFAVPASWPVENVFSVGDVLLVCGAAVGLHRICRSWLARHGEAVAQRVLHGLVPPAPIAWQEGATAALLHAAPPLHAPRAPARPRAAEAPAAPDRGALTDALASLVVESGANVQAGQVVALFCEDGHQPLARAIAREAYRAGARFVDAIYLDPHVRRARLEHAADDSFSYVPRWYGQRITAVAEERGAVIVLRGPTTLGLCGEREQRRAGLDQLPFVTEHSRAIDARTVNWTVAPAPSAAWAEVLHPRLDPDVALDRLWGDVARACRLDEPDPAGSWATRVAELGTVAGRLTALGLDALRIRGRGTDVTVGLLPTSKWVTAEFQTVGGIRHLVNLPTEEVFTAPDPCRVDGVICASRPLDLDGIAVHGLRVRFEEGRLVSLEAESGRDALAARCTTDADASRLGEIGLVDGRSRVASLDGAFGEPLLDENAASHVALGGGYAACAGAADAERVNASDVHVDVTLGGPGVDVHGRTRDGAWIPVLVDGDWRV